MLLPLLRQGLAKGLRSSLSSSLWTSVLCRHCSAAPPAADSNAEARVPGMSPPTATVAGRAARGSLQPDKCANSLLFVLTPQHTLKELHPPRVAGSAKGTV